MLSVEVPQLPANLDGQPGAPGLSYGNMESSLTSRGALKSEPPSKINFTVTSPNNYKVTENILLSEDS